MLHIFFLLGLLGCSALVAQTEIASLELSRRVPLPDFFEYSIADQSLITIGNMSRKSSRYKGITRYDSDLNKTWSKQVFTQNGRNHIDFVAVLGYSIYIFVSEYFPRESIIRTYYSQYDMSGNRIREIQELSTLSNEKEHRVEMKYVHSHDHKKLLCYKNLNNSEKDEKILYTVFDASETNPLQGELIIPYPDEKFNVRTIQVSNKGNVYVLGKRYKISAISEPDEFEFLLIRKDIKSGNSTELSIEMGDITITDLTLRIDRNENLYVAGFYSEKKSSQIIGTVYQQISNTGEANSVTHQRFSDELLSKFLSEKQIDRGQELKSFFLDNIVLRSDGGVLLLAEKYYVTFNSYMDIYGYWINEQIHHFDEIIVTSISNQGELEWGAVIPKRQSSENRINLSYTDVISSSAIHLIYETKLRKSPRSVYISRINMNGEVEEPDLLLDKGVAQLAFYPGFSQQISNSEAVIMYHNSQSKKYVIARLGFQ